MATTTKKRYKFYQKNQRLLVQRCQQPYMSGAKGATWDFGHLYLNDTKVKAYLDTTWGEYLYFEFNGEWFKVRMQPNYKQQWKGKKWDINPFCDQDKFNKITVNE